MLAFAIVLSAVPSFPIPPNEAERLLREMDAKIAAAESIRIDFVINDNNNKDKKLTDGFLVIAKRNRMHCEMIGMVAGSVVSDGKRMVIVRGPSETKSLVPPEWFNQTLQNWLGRGGTFMSFSRLLEYVEMKHEKAPDAKLAPQVGNTRMLPSDDYEGVKAQVVEYDLTWPKVTGDADTARVRVWIDASTKLPLRRTMKFKMNSEEQTFTATHVKFELNPKTDEKLFELPK